MNKLYRLISMSGLSALLLISCTKHEQPPAEPSFFLSDIRVHFFENINFNAPDKVAKIPYFLNDFTKTYNNLESNYKKGMYTSASDLDNMRLAAMYYSFGITATVRAYLDGFIKFSDIVGTSPSGLFSNLSTSDPGFQQKELEAMMKRSQEAGMMGVYVNGFNDKTYGTFMVSRQISERVKNPQHFNNPLTQDSMIVYLNSTIKDFDFFAGWNALMSQLSFTNYNDSLNTFKNPKMDVSLNNLNTRPMPPYKDRYAGLLGPIFRFDLNMKKIDWLINRKEYLNKDDLKEISAYVFKLDSLRDDVHSDKKDLLNSWEYKQTIEMRMDKLNDIKDYVARVASGSSDNSKPGLAQFFTSKNYLQAYQCYNCHRPLQ